MQLRVSESNRSFYFPPLYSPSSGSYFFSIQFSPCTGRLWHFVSKHCYRSRQDRSEHAWKARWLKRSGREWDWTDHCAHNQLVSAHNVCTDWERRQQQRFQGVIESNFAGKIITFYANFIFQFKDFPFSRNPDAECMCVQVRFTVSTQLFAHARKPYKCLVSQQFFLIFFSWILIQNSMIIIQLPMGAMKQCCARRDRYRRREPEIQRMSHDSIQNAEGRMKERNNKNSLKTRAPEKWWKNIFMKNIELTELFKRELNRAKLCGCVRCVCVNGDVWNTRRSPSNHTNA